jgi:hypothetical protein
MREMRPPWMAEVQKTQQQFSGYAPSRVESAYPKKRRLAADEHRLTQMNHVMDAPRPFTLLVGWRIRQRIEYPRLSVFICG